MYSNLFIKNFRIFGENGIEVCLNPITILTGCNSSGKSTITKALMLLRDYLNDVHIDFIKSGKILFGKHNLDFAKMNMGTFQNALNRDTKSNCFTLGYSIAPDCAAFPFQVELSFCQKEDDFMKKGWLSNITLKNFRGQIFLDADLHGDEIVFKSLSLNTIVPSFLRFVKFYSFFKTRNKIYELENRQMYEPIDETEFESLRARKQKLQSALGTIFEQDLKIVNYCNNDYFQKKYPFLFENYLFDLAEKAVADGLIFYFPVFSLLENKTKSEQLEILKSASCLEDTFRIDFELLKSRTIESFKKSEFEKFVDYFKSLEDAELDDALVGDRSFEQSQNGREDFLSYLEFALDISFNDTGSVRPFCMDDRDFDNAYVFLNAWQWKTTPDDDEFVERMMVEPQFLYSAQHKFYKALKQYAVLLVESLLDTKYIGEIQYVGNFHSDVMRMYCFDNINSSMVKILTRYLSLKKILEEKCNDSLMKWSIESDKTFRLFHAGDFINKWIKKLNIGRSLNIVPDEDNFGAKIFIRKDSKYRRGYSIADEGAGVAQLVTFLLCIETEIIQNEILRYEDYVKPDEEKSLDKRVATLVLEEPEIGLHPSFQSSLTDILLDAYKSYNIHFTIETHSEYLIRRSQAIVANYKSEKDFERNPFRVYYINPDSTIYDLEYTKTGRFNHPFGPGFFDEASRSSLEILKRERRR